MIKLGYCDIFLAVPSSFRTSSSPTSLQGGSSGVDLSESSLVEQGARSKRAGGEMPARGGCWLGTKGSGLGHSSCNQVRDPLTWVCGWETLALSKSVTKLHLTSVIPDFQSRCNIAGKKKKERKSVVLTSGICRAFVILLSKEGLSNYLSKIFYLG